MANPFQTGPDATTIDRVPEALREVFAGSRSFGRNLGSLLDDLKVNGVGVVNGTGLENLCESRVWVLRDTAGPQRLGGKGGKCEPIGEFVFFEIGEGDK
jgi:hypothetical protein